MGTSDFSDVLFFIFCTTLFSVRLYFPQEMLSFSRMKADFRVKSEGQSYGQLMPQASVLPLQLIEKASVTSVL
jgi:hypothetical protein